MSTATKKAASFRAACPFCGCGDEDTLSLSLDDLSVICGGCDETFTVAAALARAVETLAAWEKIARFVELGREMAGE